MAEAGSSILVRGPLCPAGCTAMEGMEQSSIWGCYPGFGAPHVSKVRGSSQAAFIPCYQPSFCVDSGWGINESCSMQMSLLILIPLSLLFPFMDTAGRVGDAMCPSSPRAPRGTQSTVRGVTAPSMGCVKCQPWGQQG